MSPRASLSRRWDHIRFWQDDAPQFDCRIDKPTSGRVIVAGTEVSDLSEAALATWRSRHVGFIFQRLYNLIPVLTAAENVELPLLLTNSTRRERRERALTALRVVGLADRAKHYPRQPRADRNNVSPSPGRLSPILSCSSPMSRREIWMREARKRFST